MFRVVQVEHRNAFETQPLKAFLQRLARPRRIKTAGFHIAVELGGKDGTLRQSAPLADHRSDPGLTPTEAVVVGCVDAI